MRIRKGYQIKNATLSDNTIGGAAAVMGNLDRGDDVLFPGAFDGVLPAFVADGFIAVGHNWSTLPVAMPTLAEVRGRDLYSEAVFHTTPEAQAARTVARERIEANKSVGLSIGFDMLSSGFKWFENGEELLTFARETMRLDMGLFDTAGIAACHDSCRGVFKVSTLYEWSIVPVPMNAQATAYDAKSEGRDALTIRDIERTLRDAGLSRKDAAAVAAHGYPVLQRDADDGSGLPGGDARAESDRDSWESFRLRTEWARKQHRLKELGVPA